jgi:hypothetical protein
MLPLIIPRAQKTGTKTCSPRGMKMWNVGIIA